MSALSGERLRQASKRAQKVTLMAVNGEIDGRPRDEINARIREYLATLSIEDRYDLEEFLGDTFGDSFRQAAGRVPMPPGD